MDEPMTAPQEFKIKWVFPPGLQTHFVTNFIVAHQPDLITISAHQVFAPLGPELTGEPLPDKIDAVALSRLTMTFDTAKKLHKVLGKNLEQYEKTIAAIDKAEREAK